MTEIAKRLSPTSETLRELFLKSGNYCAFPNCRHLMMNEMAEFIGQLCHIEAAAPGGERFNANMTNEERRAPSNLMLMCYEHHIVTNNVATYTVAKLKKIKAEHESRFSHPDRAILSTLTDYTMATKPTKVTTLGRMYEAFKWEIDVATQAECINDLNKYIEAVRLVPIELRRLLGAIACRTNRMRNSAVVRGNAILISDIEEAHGRQKGELADSIKKLDAYGMANIGTIDINYGDAPSIEICDTEGGWAFWFDLVKFCEITSEPLEAFTDDLDFGRLDE